MISTISFRRYRYRRTTTIYQYARSSCAAIFRILRWLSGSIKIILETCSLNLKIILRSVLDNFGYHQKTYRISAGNCNKCSKQQQQLVFRVSFILFLFAHGTVCPLGSLKFEVVLSIYQICDSFQWWDVGSLIRDVENYCSKLWLQLYFDVT